MYEAYGEFLSLARIDSFIDGLNKAYLDSELIRLKRESQKHGSENLYRQAVRNFRRENLDAFTLPEEPGKLDAKNPQLLSAEERSRINSHLEKNEPERTRFIQAADYLYWFDIRAEFWAERTVDEQISSALESPESLTKLKAAAEQMRAQRDRALAQGAQNPAKRTADDTSPRSRPLSLLDLK
jgi:hypothetical protein